MGYMASKLCGRLLQESIKQAIGVFVEPAVEETDHQMVRQTILSVLVELPFTIFTDTFNALFVLPPLIEKRKGLW